ncbi:MAG: hypothetical protein LBL83_03660 [Clostridiales bacterium]|nr:hypothetical protein [Clostridiales bacterium]
MDAGKHGSTDGNGNGNGSGGGGAGARGGMDAGAGAVAGAGAGAIAATAATAAAKVRGIKGIFTKAPEQTPSRGEPDGALCGNGDIGVCAGNSPDKLTFWICKNDIWRAKPHQNGGGARSFGYLQLDVPQLAGAEFYAEQHIAAADIHTDMAKGGARLKTKTYADYNANVVVTTLSNAGDEAIGVRVSLRAIRGNEPVEDFVYYHVGTEQYETTGREAVCSEGAAGNALSMSKAFRGADLDWEVEAFALSKVLGKESAEFELGAGEEVTVVTAACTSFDAEGSPESACRELIGRMCAEGAVQAARAEHERWWEDFWSTSSISIPGEPEIEKYWYASHYLLACCCKAGKFAPGLYGAWVTTDEPNWGGDYHFDYNHEAPWWGVYSSNKVGLADVYDTPLLEYVDMGTRRARELLGARGILQMVGIGPKGCNIGEIFFPDGALCPLGAYWGQKFDAVYAALNMVTRYYMTCDGEYARKILPYLVGAVEFWEDWLELEDGRYVIYNDYAGENGWALGDPGRSDKHDPKHDFNPLISLAFIRIAAKGLIDIAGDLGLYQERLPAWQDMLDRLSEFPTHEVNGKTVYRLQERNMPQEGKGRPARKNVGTAPIFPGNFIGAASSGAELEIARNSFEEAVSWEHFNAFSIFYPMAARVGYPPDEIIRHLNDQIRNHSFGNFFIYYGGGGIECCSGVPCTVNEMLLQSHQGEIRLFPNWDRAKDASFDSLRAYGAFLVSASIEGGEIGEVRIESEKGRRCRLHSPWDEGLSVYCDGRLVPVTSVMTKKGEDYRFGTKPGKTYAVVKGSKRVEA